ncbi:hypothetical protein B0T24DRAFT_218899 [Lasiosphaeria ovina]|uniref:3'(2'),5'-bisphosphate nucleotidase n=1 Tax=Lasiosphaeria ovina TaxID=92902 RepID=A0AAE0KHM5_9PEZI|nr:hypothetical protein B0T24DRAFT_218899 [Lasiosphaeria ovina]
MIVPISPSSPFARERFIAELAVQRASILTKRLLPSSPFDAATTVGTNGITSSNGPATTTTAGGATAPRPNHLDSSHLHNGYNYARKNSQMSKSDASPVTAGDFAAQALLISAVHGAFPDDGFVGEEDANALRRDPELARQVWEFVTSTHLDDAASDALLATPATIEDMFDVIDLGGKGRGGPTGRFWALDPIDGTAAFIKGQQYAMSLALIDGGREVVGVLGCPNLRLLDDDDLLGDGDDASSGGGRTPVEETSVDEYGMGLMLSAVRGQGTIFRRMGRGELLDARRIEKVPHPAAVRAKQLLNQQDNGHLSVPAPAAVELRNLHFIDSSVSTATLSEKTRQLAEACGAPYPGTEVYSSHMRYAALVLGGREHVQVRVPKTRDAAWCIWDHAGSQLIYTESGGGRVTDLLGKDIDFGSGRELTRNWGLITADYTVHGKIFELVTDMLKADAAAAQ